MKKRKEESNSYAEPEEEQMVQVEAMTWPNGGNRNFSLVDHSQEIIYEFNQVSLIK